MGKKPHRFLRCRHRGNGGQSVAELREKSRKIGVACVNGFIGEKPPRRDEKLQPAAVNDSRQCHGNGAYRHASNGRIGARQPDHKRLYHRFVFPIFGGERFKIRAAISGFPPVREPDRYFFQVSDGWAENHSQVSFQPVGGGEVTANKVLAPDAIQFCMNRFSGSRAGDYPLK
jgi:hypothetical protein